MDVEWMITDHGGRAPEYARRRTADNRQAIFSDYFNGECPLRKFRGVERHDMRCGHYFIILIAHTNIEIIIMPFIEYIISRHEIR